MSKHTKGPWEVIDHNGPQSIYGPDGERVARLGFMDAGEGGRPRQNANASLIASAPDLLEALEGLLKAIGEHATGSFGEAEDKARDAIKRSKGEA